MTRFWFSGLSVICSHNIEKVCEVNKTGLRALGYEDGRAQLPQDSRATALCYAVVPSVFLLWC